MRTTTLTAAAIAAACGLSANAQVITDVSDNDGGDYVLAQGAFGEGVDAFSDADGSWTDTPDFLEGADYVLTANGDNSNSDLEVILELSGPGTLFVFHSDSVDDPDWLLSNFTDTGENLSLSTEEDGEEDSVAYSIFSLDFDDLSTFTTFDNDPNTTNSEQQYGIAAVPAPGAFAALGLAGVAAVRRRR